MKISKRTQKKITKELERVFVQMIKKNPFRVLLLTLVAIAVLSMSLVFVTLIASSVDQDVGVEREAVQGMGENVNNSENEIDKTFAKVTRVVDGDTIQVDIDGDKFTVRLIGIDTPETVAPRKEVECFGKEASDFLKNLIDSKTVELVEDKTQGNTDRYGRLLRYVFLDELNVNLKLVEQGYAYEYTFRSPYNFQTEFKNAQNEAMQNQLGLWDEICDGSRR